VIPKWSVAVKKSEANALSTTARMCAAFRSDSAKYFCVVLSETGPDHLHVIAEEVSRVAELCIAQGNPTRFRGVRVGFDVAIKTSASDSEATAVRWRCQAKVVDRIAKCYAYFLLSVLSP
jgi:hypothetical protein